ncbi:YcgN family cysteine cluster protein [Verrucomicrobiota bacterium]
MKPFWKNKDLSELSREEWESLCDGCALCCRLKEENEETGEAVYTQIACRLLDIETGRCRDYENRKKLVAECIHLTPENVPRLRWLPSSCAYRLLVEGYDLPPWHPLITGDPKSVHNAGFNVRDRVISEVEALQQKDKEG